jgi:hypothetical protein
VPGPQGPQGNPGATGATGPTGPQGPTAISINAGNVAKLGTDNLTMVPGPTSGNATGIQVVLASDTRLADSRTPLPHEASHVTGADQIPNAGSSARGLLAQLSGNATDYVGGDNACHPLPVPPAFGGILTLVDATHLKFAPFKGDRIKINGAIYAIPSAGIVGLTNTSVFVNGVAGQNLAASTIYLVYCFVNSGTLTADFSTTTHVTSSTSGNVGIEIKSGDDTRSLVGLIATNASSQFNDSAASRLTRSWFNRPTALFNSGLLSVSVSNTSAATIYTATFVAFAGENLEISAQGYLNAATQPDCYMQLLIDGTVQSPNSVVSIITANRYFPTVTAANAQITNDTIVHNWSLQNWLSSTSMTYAVNALGKLS